MVHVCSSPNGCICLMHTSRRSQGAVGDWRAKCQVGSYLGLKHPHRRRPVNWHACVGGGPCVLIRATWLSALATRTPAPYQRRSSLCFRVLLIPTGAMTYVQAAPWCDPPTAPLSLFSPKPLTPQRHPSPSEPLCHLAAKTGFVISSLKNSGIRARPSRPRPRSPSRPPRLWPPLQPLPCQRMRPLPQQPRRLPSRWQPPLHSCQWHWWCW